MNERPYDTIVIGGGAAGLCAAVAAARCGDRVLVLERMDRVGKKILATGNGRCNLMNTSALRYPGGAEFARKVLERCGVAEQTAFWRDLGVMLREEEQGRVYPVSNHASSVLDALRLALDRDNVKVVCSAEVTAVGQQDAMWMAATSETTYTAAHVIITGGGCAQPKLGSNGTAVKLLEQLGHRSTKLRPALTQIETEQKQIRGLSGIRVRGSVSVCRDGKTIHREQGEILFADYGISGVCAMQCARYVWPGRDVLRLDLGAAMGFATPEELTKELLRRKNTWKDTNAENLLTGLAVPRLAAAIMSCAGKYDRQEPIASLKNGYLQAVANCCFAFELPVKGIHGFDQAQVMAGGINTAGFDPETMSSLALKGLYAAGEVLDVDGDCGGYNLMFAFGSGILAGLRGRRNPWRKDQ